MLLSYQKLLCLLLSLVFFCVISFGAENTLKCSAETMNYCNVMNCAESGDCFHGVIYDECQCCKYCLRKQGEKCGGERNIDGVCDRGLTCMQTFDYDANSFLTENKTGVCQILNCTDIKCSTDNDTVCPADSFKLPTNECCPTERCACIPQICKKTQCPAKKMRKVLRPGNGLPGTCCEIVDCIDVPRHCMHNNQRFNDGEKWHPDKCTTCICKEGLTFCHVHQCSPIAGCNHFVIPEGECCPVCAGCVSSSGLFYNNSDTWNEDSCIACQCINGITHCKTEICQSSCEHPVYVPGQCCPKCSEMSRKDEVTLELLLKTKIFNLTVDHFENSALRNTDQSSSNPTRVVNMYNSLVYFIFIKMSQTIYKRLFYT